MLIDQIRKQLKQVPFRPFALEIEPGVRISIVAPDHIMVHRKSNRVVVFDQDGLVDIFEAESVRIVEIQ
jgi:hypothetical protein